MEKEFIPYEQALALKELGFNRRTLAQYSTRQGSEWVLTFDLSGEGQYPKGSSACIAPTFSQAFRWFREKYDLLGYVNDESSIEDDPNIHEKWMYVIQELPIILHDDLSNDKIYKTYEEAELECLKKLIEIVKK